MLIKDNFGNLGISVYNMPVSCTSRVIEVFALGGGAESAHSAGFSLFLGVKKFRSLAVEKEVKGVNLSFAPLRLNLASVVFPRHPIPECVMLNLFQHLTGLACDLPSCKILNSSKIEWETNTHNNIIKTDFNDWIENGMKG